MFALIFWRRGLPVGAPEYIALSPTFESRDGEYRPRVLPYGTFARACAEFSRQLAPFEEALLELQAQGHLALSARSRDSRLSAWAEEHRSSALALAAVLVLDLEEAARGATPPHASPPFIGLAAGLLAARPGLRAAVERLRLVPETSALRSWLTRGVADRLSLTCGAKLVPLSVRETMAPGDPSFGSWRELAVAQAATDLVLSFAAPAIPLHGGWAYVEGTGPGPFENPAMAARFLRSGAAAEALASLREARRRAGRIAPPTYHTAAFDARLFKAIAYAQSFLLMSGTALLHSMEHVGWSLASHGRRERRLADGSEPGVGAFANEGQAARLLFELAYTATCLHEKLGVAHTDVHSNNVTYFPWGLDRRPLGWSRPGEPLYSDPLAAYVAGPRGEANTFLFPAAGDGCFLVDWSRCILGPGFRPRLEAGRPAFAAERFYRDQVGRALRALARYSPEFVRERQAALKAALLASPEAAFRVLCTVDFIAIGANVGGTLRAMAAETAEGDLRRFEVAPRVLELAGELETAAREAFAVGLRALADNPSAPPPPFPGPALLRQVFGEWLFPRWAAREPGRLARAQLVDAFNANNELKASCRDYELFPRWARLDEIEKHLGQFKLAELFERGPGPFLDSLGLRPYVEAVAEKARTEEERLDGRPAETSSWLED